MSVDDRPNADSRTMDELIGVALSEPDENIVWKAIASLHWRGTREILQRAEALCGSPCSRERQLGANILGQLGLPDRTFPAECTAILRSMLRSVEQSDVLRSVLVALSHQHDAEAVPIVVRFSASPDAEVRHGVVLALTGHEMSLAIENLISLSKDSDSHVRDWATFALGTQLELDTPEIRQALADRLDDTYDDARAEALVGLARRKDIRVVEALKRELSSDCVGTLAIEAAELVASKDLYAHLVALREWWDEDSKLLERAIAASAL